MCVTCGCLRPADPHGDDRNLVLADLDAAAAAARITVPAAAANISRTLASAAADAGALLAAELARPALIVDVDGVLARYLEGACEAVNGRFGTSYTPAAWRTYPGPFTFTQRQWLVENRHSDGAFWLSLAPDTAAVDALRGLAADGYRITVSSDRPAAVRLSTQAWIQFHGVPANSVYLAGPGGKRASLDLYPPSVPVVLFDDAPARWIDCSAPNVRILVPRSAYTPDAAAYPNVSVFDSWAAVPALLAEHPSPPPAP